MLHSYAFSNYQSFVERVEIDLTVNAKTSLTDWMVEPVCGDRVSKILAVIGHNASGKTTLLKPMAFLSWFISQSFAVPIDSAIPINANALHTKEPSEFECLVDFEGVLWRYVLRCTPQRVLHEALYCKPKYFNYVFIRDWDEETHSYRVKQKDFGLLPKLAVKVRQNVSLISWAAQYDVPLAKRLSVNNVFTNVNFSGKVSVNDQSLYVAAEHFAFNPTQKAMMNKLLSLWDLGLSAVDIQEIQTNPIDAPEEKAWLPVGKHISNAKTFELPFYFESSGTQGAFVLLSRLLPVLENGGLAVIDEFENDLHPNMLEPILDLFAHPKTNPHNAQLIFSTHATRVLNLVEKSQVVLVEKDPDCISDAYRLDTVQGIRNDDNFYAKYMAGSYGAVPNV
jgi:hypothetical protein